VAIAVASSEVSQGAVGRPNSDWYGEDVEDKDRGRRLRNWMDGIENTSWTKRWASLVFYRYMTGRTTGPIGYNYSSTARPGAANIYSRAVFEAPRYNVLAQCNDALANRVYKSRPFLQVCPIDGDFTTRFDARSLTQYMDAVFYSLHLWEMVELCGFDSRIWGDGFLKIDNGVNNHLTATRILSDEIVVDENECNTGKLSRLGIRVFVSRKEMLQQPYIKNDPKAVDAVKRAPKSNNGFYFGGDIDYTDVIVLREGWSFCQKDTDGNEIPGYHIIAVGDYTLKCEEWMRDHAPIARLPFKLMPTGYYSQGMPEMALGLQRELDRTMAANWENRRRAAWPRIGIAQGSNVDPGKLGDKSNGIYYYTGTKPEFDFPMATPPEQFQYEESIIRRIKEVFRLNDQQMQGARPKAISGKAVNLIDELDDAAHADLFQHMEDFVEQVGNLIIEASEDSKPKVTLPGRQAQLIDWASLNWDEKKFYLRPFPVGRLSQSIAVRQEQIRTWYAEGAISKQTKMRLEQVPDTDGYQSLANAAQDFIEMQLDEMIQTGKYQPPEPWVDVDAAMETAQARYCYERTLKTPQDRTDMVLRYISALDELKSAAGAAMQGAMAPAPAPGSPEAMAMPPGGAAPGAPPIAPAGIPGLPNLQPGQAPAPPAFPAPQG
jgi:hypothetical protein